MALMNAAMFPCSECHRHLRDADRVCPFCGTHQHTVEAPEPGVPSVWGAGVLVAAMLCTGCGKSPADPGASDGNTTSTSSTTTASESGTDTESSTGVDSNDDADDTPDPSGGFYAGPDEDFGGVSECDQWIQDCPEGEKCVPYGSTGGIWDANKCVPVMGDGQAGDPCLYGGVVEATDDCDADSYCWDVLDVEGMAVGTCTPFCEGTPDDPVCDSGTSCLIEYEGSVALCVDSCDPVAQDCDPGLACYWGGTEFLCLLNVDEIPAGEPCDSLNDCAAGNACLDGAMLPDCMGDTCCVEFCALDDPDACAGPMLECTAFFDEGMAPEGYENVGVCTVPEP